MWKIDVLRGGEYQEMTVYRTNDVPQGNTFRVKTAVYKTNFSIDFFHGSVIVIGAFVGKVKLMAFGL